MEERLAASAHIPFRGLTSRKLRRLLSPDTLVTAAALAKGCAEALGALSHFKADLVIATGGYVSAAVVLAQALRRGKILIHEQNVVPGRTNLWLGRFADRVCVSFDSTAQYFAPKKTIVTGLPIRSTLRRAMAKEDARRALGIRPDRFTILVLGGSQGARRLNEIVAGAIGDLRDLPVQVLHQVGERNFDEADGLRRSLCWADYHVRAYLEDMLPAYSAADILVSRSGASTVAEVTAIGIPAIFVPYPHHRDQQQVHNANFVVRNGGALMIQESDLSAKVLADVIRDMFGHPDRLDAMSRASKSLGRPDAAEKIAALALSMKE